MQSEEEIFEVLGLEYIREPAARRYAAKFRLNRPAAPEWRNADI